VKHNKSQIISLSFIKMYMSSSKRIKMSHGTSKEQKPTAQRNIYFMEHLKKLNTAYVSKHKELTDDASIESQRRISNNADEYVRKARWLKRYFCGSIGDTYVFGMGEDKQLGFPDLIYEPPEEEEEESKKESNKNEEEVDPYANLEEISISIPRKLSIPDVSITHISAGSLHTLAITSRGQVYGWGCTHGFCLGVDVGPGFVNAPRLLKNEDGLDYENNHYIQAHAGSTFSLVLSCQGDIFSAGMFRDVNGGQYKLTRSENNEDFVGCNNKFAKMTSFLERNVRQISGGEQRKLSIPDASTSKT